jgi:hypothetical protein
MSIFKIMISYFTCFKFSAKSSKAGSFSYQFNNIQSTSSPILKFRLYLAHLLSPSQPLCYRVHSCSVNRDFPVLVTIFCVSILVTFFPCFNNIFSLFNLQGFPCFTKNSALQGYPCIGYNFFTFQL